MLLDKVEESDTMIMETPPLIHESRPIVAEKMTAKNLNCFFGKTHAIKDVTLGIPTQKVLAIIGPSGCGKSTFLRSLNRMHEVAGGTMTGTVLLDGMDIYQNDPVVVRRRVGMVFQKANPFPTMSIFDNVAAGMRLNGIRDKHRTNETVERSLKQAALWDEVKDSLNKS